MSFTKDEIQHGDVYYNFEMMRVGIEETPGTSVFYKDEAGTIFHTYSSYARGADILINTYNFLDLTPKGRDEEGLAHSMAWMRHHDRYDEDYAVDATAPYQLPEIVRPSCCAEEHDHGHATDAAALTYRKSSP